MKRTYLKPTISKQSIDVQIVMMAPSDPPGGWEPGDGKPPWTGNPDKPGKPKTSLFDNSNETISPFNNQSPF